MIQITLSFRDVMQDSKFRDVTGKTFTKVSDTYALARNEDNKLVMFSWECPVEQDYDPSWEVQ